MRGFIEAPFTENNIFPLKFKMNKMYLNYFAKTLKK